MAVVRLVDTPPRLSFPDDAPSVKYDMPSPKPTQTSAEAKADEVFNAMRGFITRYVDARTAKVEDEFLRLLLQLEARVDELEKRERR